MLCNESSVISDRVVWQSVLKCEMDKETCSLIVSNKGSNIAEAKGGGMLFKTLNRVYYASTKLHRMGLSQDKLCWRCKGGLWDCPVIQPLWGRALQCMEDTLGTQYQEPKD